MKQLRRLENSIACGNCKKEIGEDLAAIMCRDCSSKLAGPAQDRKRKKESEYQKAQDTTVIVQPQMRASDIDNLARPAMPSNSPDMSNPESVTMEGKKPKVDGSAPLVAYELTRSDAVKKIKKATKQHTCYACGTYHSKYLYNSGTEYWVSNGEVGELCGQCYNNLIYCPMYRNEHKETFIAAVRSWQAAHPEDAIRRRVYARKYYRSKRRTV
jgi:hypothetical protein